MNVKHRPTRPQGIRGSAFISVMMFTAILLLIMSVLLRLSLTERKLNKRNAYWLEARNAAEALAEYGFSQVATRYQNISTPPSFNPAISTSALALPPATAFTGTNIDTTAYSSAHTTGWQLLAGTTGQYSSGSADVLINRFDPANSAGDSLAGSTTRIQNVQVLAKATCVPTDGSSPITCFVRQTVSVRSTPIFTNAIFYFANDLEIFPGPAFDIYGPVRVNGNMFASSQGTSLTFHDTVAISGELYHAWSNQNPAADGTGSEALGSAPVSFATSVSGNTQKPMQDAISHIWEDSTNGTDSSLFSSGLYVDRVTAALSQLQTKALAAVSSGSTTSNQAAFDVYAHNTWNGNVQTGSMGIMPTSPVSYNTPIDAAGDLPDPHTMIEPPAPPPAGTYQSALQQVETQKMSTQASLYIKVNSAGTITAYGPPAGVTGTPNGGALLGTLPANLVTYIPYSASGSTVTSGIYDRRQSAGVNLVQIDMGKLKAALDVPAGTSGAVASNAIKDASNNTWGNGASGWNGGIYVDVPEPASPGAGVTQTAVILSNGTVASGNSLLPTTNSVHGLTVATNAPVYVLGNFNADGTIATGATGSATTPDNGNISSTSAEVPAAIYADSITLLSDNYFGTGSGGTGSNTVPSANLGSSSARTVVSSSSTPSASGDIEVAAAMVTGLVPTTSGASSGGVHNLPRFLENWGGNTVAIRGSMIAMYNSKTAIGPWSTNYYSPPTRVWGYDKLFQNGNFPPLTSRTLTFRRMQSGITTTSSQYATAVNTLWGTGIYP